MDFQGTLFEPSVDVPGVRGIGPPIAHPRRLGGHPPDWLPDADEVLARLVGDVPWRAERRPMYDRVVDVPRLLHTYGVGEPLPHPALARARGSLSAYYRPELGEPFVTAGCCYYRDGRDSVAWHGDTIGRGKTQDTMVAIVSLGDPRKLMLRPRVGGASISVEMGHGDLLVMGGSCQRTWEHAVPKGRADHDLCGPC